MSSGHSCRYAAAITKAWRVFPSPISSPSRHRPPRAMPKQMPSFWNCITGRSWTTSGGRARRYCSKFCLASTSLWPATCCSWTSLRTHSGIPPTSQAASTGLARIWPRTALNSATGNRHSFLDSPTTPPAIPPARRVSSCQTGWGMNVDFAGARRNSLGLESSAERPNRCGCCPGPGCTGGGPAAGWPNDPIELLAAAAPPTAPW
mmetsp:Transcript_79081/g.223808  ORF Transcript_79081/g.223808 Transcript_79081/m.223808 type:complete len:205 (-) Transcript_79081:64-678(-)